MPRTRFGAFARGAKVVLYTKKSGAHLRIIDGGSGYLCEMEPVAHFGLGELGPMGTVADSAAKPFSVLCDSGTGTPQALGMELHCGSTVDAYHKGNHLCSVVSLCPRKAAPSLQEPPHQGTCGLSSP